MFLYIQYLVFVGGSLDPDMVRLPIRLGDTIPGYVAATQIVVNINLIKQVWI